MADTSARTSLAGLAVELTGECNQKCRYCYNGWRGESVPSPGCDPDVQVRRVRRLIDTFDIRQVTITGGEPFASPAVFDLLELLASRQLPTSIISNGALIDETRARHLADFRLGYVQITLTGADAELHDEHTLAGQFDRTLAGIRALQRNGVKVGGCIVVTHRNAAHVASILDLWQSLNARQIALSRFSPAGYGSTFAAELLPTRDDMHAALDQALPFAQRGMRLFSAMPLPPCVIEVERYKDWIRIGSCSIATAKQVFALGTGGELRNCTLHRTAIGGVQDILSEDADLTRLVHDADVMAYRSQVPEFCQGCSHAASCGGGCGAASEWLFGGRRHTPDPFLWQHVDEEFATRLRGGWTAG
jgi:radical SAM protein with 4Fe4S-binding SPASM domain